LKKLYKNQLITKKISQLYKNMGVGI